MSDGPADSEMRDGEGVDPEIDPGEPLAQLAEFDHDASGDLLTRIRRTIQRRTTAGQLMSFSWSAPLVVMREFWLMLIEQLNPKGTGKDGRDGRKTF
jgi:hypothetical protein